MTIFFGEAHTQGKKGLQISPARGKRQELSPAYHLEVKKKIASR
jgi:hypothetical protein